MAKEIIYRHGAGTPPRTGNLGPDQKIILFEAGTHGNFLKRFLNVCAGEQEEHDFYSGHHGAHSPVGNSTEVKYVNYHPHPDDKDIDIWVYINIKPEDMYVLNWHVYYAAGESGIEVLDNSADFSKRFIKNFYDKRFLQNNKDLWPTTRRSTLDQFSPDDNGVREFFKYCIHAEHVINENNKRYSNYNIQNVFEFNWFYAGEDVFVKHVKQLLGNKYTQDCSQYNSFYEKKQGILHSQQRVQAAFECLLNNQNYDIGDFCIYEQAGLDCLIEEHYNIKLQTYYKNYPSNISNYNIQEDK